MLFIISKHLFILNRIFFQLIKKNTRYQSFKFKVFLLFFPSYNKKSQKQQNDASDFPTTQLVMLTKITFYISFCQLFFRVFKYLLRGAVFYQFTQIHKAGIICCSDCLLHIVRDNDNGIVFF